MQANDILAFNGGLTANNLDRSVIVAVSPVRVMQSAVDQVIDMVTMRNSFMPASWAMNVIDIMIFVTKVRRATNRILRAHFDDMFFDNRSALVMQVTIMKVVNVAAMLDSYMAARWPVLVRMICMGAVLEISH